jgi:hypothetical protein
MTGRRALVPGVWLALALLAAPAPTRAAPFEPADRDWEGCAGLFDIARATLGKDRVVAVSRLDWSELGPTDGLLFIHPDRSVDGDRLFAFLDAGGRAAVIDDFGAGDRILERFHIERVPPPASPINALRHNAELAVADPVSEGGRVHPSVEGVERLVTNHPTALRYTLDTPDAPTPVLVIHVVDGPDSVLAMAGAVGRGGKLFAMGDPSALINQMLRYPGNRAFATSLIRFLARDAASDRGRLYVVANRFTETGTYGGVSAVFSAFENASASVRQAVRDFSADGLDGPLGVALAAALAVAAGGWTVRRTSRVHRPAVPAFARRTPVAAQGGVSGRAALVSRSPDANAVAMLELKGALEDGLSHAIGLEGPVSSEMLLDHVRAKAALDEPGFQALKGMLARMAHLETRFAAGRPARLRDRDLARAARTAFDLIAMARARCGAGAAS